MALPRTHAETQSVCVCVIICEKRTMVLKGNDLLVLILALLIVVGQTLGHHLRQQEGLGQHLDQVLYTHTHKHTHTRVSGTQARGFHAERMLGLMRDNLRLCKSSHVGADG